MSLTSTRGEDATRPDRHAALVGNRMALAGAVLYLCEFVGLVLSHAQHLPHVPGTPPGSIVASYAGHAGGLGFLVGWFGLVQAGRVLFVLGVATALARSGRPDPLLGFATALTVIGVALEIGSEALAAGAAELAARGQSGGAIALDRGASYLAAGLLAPTGLALLLTAWAMLRSALFSRVLAGLGLLAGLAVVGAGLASGPANADLQDTLSTGVLVMWVFMLWAGVVLWRRTPAGARGSGLRP